MSTKVPADPPMERGVNPVRPAAAPPPRKPAAPPPKSSGFQRFVLQFLLLVIALGGAFGTGYLVNANEMQLNRSDLLQQQLDAQERILALEQQIAELLENRESGNRVELDLTDLFEPIRDAVGRIALVRMGEISREITTELSKLVEADLPALDDSATASGAAAAPGATRGGIDNGGATDQASEPEAASAAGETVVPQSGSGPDSLQPNSAASGEAEPPRPAVELAGSEPEPAAPPPVTAVPAASLSSPANEAPADILGLPAASEEPVADEASRSEARSPAVLESVTAAESRSTQAKPTDVAELLGAARPPGLEGVAPTIEP